mmetsp:Transcript_37221/g.119955  ORF Transcript_37221/g.119955 Transcript_37221/m.119955 type:complete len:235 (+) Transcript_37221:221-925(+)
MPAGAPDASRSVSTTAAAAAAPPPPHNDANMASAAAARASASGEVSSGATAGSTRAGSRRSKRPAARAREESSASERRGTSEERTSPAIPRRSRPLLPASRQAEASTVSPFARCVGRGESRSRTTSGRATRGCARTRLAATVAAAGVAALVEWSASMRGWMAAAGSTPRERSEGRSTRSSASGSGAPEQAADEAATGGKRGRAWRDRKAEASAGGSEPASRLTHTRPLWAAAPA